MCSRSLIERPHRLLWRGLPFAEKSPRQGKIIAWSVPQAPAAFRKAPAGGPEFTRISLLQPPETERRRPTHSAGACGPESFDSIWPPRFHQERPRCSATVLHARNSRRGPSHREKLPDWGVRMVGSGQPCVIIPWTADSIWWGSPKENSSKCRPPRNNFQKTASLVIEIVVYNHDLGYTKVNRGYRKPNP